MRIASTIQDSIVDGPGLRFVVFAQGCPHHCPGCHNPATHEFAEGRETSADELIAALFSNPLTDGLTISGGEPFSQAPDCAKLASAAHEKGLNVWAYSGWTLEELLERAKTDEGTGALLGELDVLVDGRFELECRSLTLRWRGSANQRVLDMKKSRECGKAIWLEGCEQ